MDVIQPDPARSHGRVDRVVIDAHLHLWNTGRLRYEWLQRPENAAINRTFGFEGFRARAAAAGVDRAVLLHPRPGRLTAVP
jgi:predicted TIM-barrel fold metal-dependent hydrolase